jgi:hypothetical protein
VSYVYIKSESELWTVGFYGPRGEWVPESDHSNREQAAERVAWLNGTAEFNDFCGHRVTLNGHTGTVTPYTGQSGDALTHGPKKGKP